MFTSELSLHISPAAWVWLVRQRGELAPLQGNREAWCDAFAADTLRTMHQIGFVPNYMLDIGSGLGAIDVLMAKQGTHCTLVDSVNGTGECTKHDVPFCNQVAVHAFMKDNGIPRTSYLYYDPSQLGVPRYPVSQLGRVPQQFALFDCVVSFRSWCFHYAPSVYLEFVKKHVTPGTRIFLDVRKNCDWRAQLKANWEEMEVLDDAAKFWRIEYRVRGRTQ